MDRDKEGKGSSIFLDASALRKAVEASRQFATYQIIRPTEVLIYTRESNRSVLLNRL